MRTEPPSVEDFDAALKQFTIQFPWLLIEVRPHIALSLLGCLQLVLKHPHLPDDIQLEMTKLAVVIESFFKESPLLARVAQIGWQRESGSQLPTSAEVANDFAGFKFIETD